MANLATNLLTAGAAVDIHDAKPPVELPHPWVWVWWALAAVLVAAGCLAWLRWRSRRPAPQIPVVPPHIRAKQKLAEALRFIGDPKLFCTMVADTVRYYLEERFTLRAPERTTEEFLIELQGSRHLLPDQKQSLGMFLQNCDLVKFARFEPTEAALRELHDAALRLIDETQFETVHGSPSSSPATAPTPPSSAPPPPGIPPPPPPPPVVRAATS